MSETEPKIINPDLLKAMPLPETPAKGQRPQRGAMLVVVGSKHQPGPAILAARAALRCGIEVYLAAPESIALQISIMHPEVLPIPLPESPNGTVERDGLGLLKEQAAACTAAVLSPGSPRDEANIRQLQEVLDEMSLPLVADHATADVSKRKAKQNSNSTATRIWIVSQISAGNAADSLDSWGKQAAERNATHIVMANSEGAPHVIAPDGTQYKDTTEACGLQVSGSSHVLSGIVAAFLAQKVEPITASVWGVHILTQAMEAAQKDLGDNSVIAGDLPQRIPSVIRYLKRTIEQRKDSQPFGLRRNV